MARHSHGHRYSDDSSTTSSGSDSSASDSRSDSEDEERAPITHHYRHRRHTSSAAPADNRIWFGAAAFVLLIALLVVGVYGYQHGWSLASLGLGSTTSDGLTGSGAESAAGSDAGGDSSAGLGGSEGSTDTSAEPSATATGQGSSGDTGASGGDGAASSSGGYGPAATATKPGSAAGANSTTTPASTGGSGGSSQHQILGFWENWTGQTVAETDFTPYTHAMWFVGVPGEAKDKGKLNLGETSPGQAKDWAQAAQKAGAKPMLSIGGWSGSSTFSSLIATSQSRTDFVETISDALDASGFVGCDLDWEYPGRAGDTQNFDVKNDLSNWLSFIKALREKLGPDKLISADTSSTPWVGPDGNPSSDMSQSAAVLDFITIMTYDSVTYSSSVTGPNFAYEDSYAPPAQKFSIPATVKAWTDAKFPANKIMLGIATYGYAWKVDSVKPDGGATGASSGIYQTAASTLTSNDGSYVYDKIAPQIASMQRTFDKCSSTPYLYSSSSKLFIAYDDEESIKIKGGYAGMNGLMGCSLYAGLTQNKDSTLAKVAKGVC
ncbi:hypothetical protein JCM8202_004852 [Rhodotorula sphaerocarpa]